MSPPFSVKIEHNHARDTENQRTPAAPLIFASPHSGNIYPDAFRDMSLLSKTQLRRNEDIWIDALFAPCVSRGAAQLKANFPRSFVDVNRSADEYIIDENSLQSVLSTRSGMSKVAPPHVSARAKVGLGVVPLIISENVPIYAKPPKLADVKARLDALYFPYHAALTKLTETVLNAHGRCLLIDCHSMPGFAPMGARRADIILGDCHGMSCRPETIDHVERAFKQFGYSVTRNAPYAGGYVTSHYSRVTDGLETLQIEINRDLYVNPVTFKKKPGYEKLAFNLNIIIQEIITDFMPDAETDVALAAE